MGRLAEAVPVEGRAAAVPVEGRAALLPVEGVGRGAVAGCVEGPAPPEPQPRASVLRAEFAAVGEPLLLSRLWSGCHFCPLVDVGRAPVPVLMLVFRLTFLSMSTSTSP